MLAPQGSSKETFVHSVLRGRHAEWMLAFVSFVESLFMPILIEPFMLLPILSRPKDWFRLTTIVTTFSVLGGIAGYFLGMFFFDLVGRKLVALYGLEPELEQTIALFNAHVFWVIFAGAFTPLPYKLFTLVGGFLRVDFAMFVLASIVGRGLRFYAVGFVLGKFGERAFPAFHKHFNTIAFATLIVMLVYALFKVL